MTDTDYSDLIVIIATAKDCGKCVQMKNQGVMSKIISGLEKRGVKVKEIVWESRRQPYPITDRISEYMGKIVGWFPQIIVLPLSYYDHAERYNVNDIIKVTHIFNGEYNYETLEPEQRRTYQMFNDTNLELFLKNYLESPEYMQLLPQFIQPTPSYSSRPYTDTSRPSGQLSRQGYSRDIGIPKPSAISSSSSITPSSSSLSSSSSLTSSSSSNNTRQRSGPSLDVSPYTTPASKSGKVYDPNDFILYSRGF